MKYIKRFIVFMLVVSLCAGFAVPAMAADTYTRFTPSDGLIALIQRYEGFSPKRQWDYKQYSIGYGCSFTLAREMFPSDASDDEFTITQDQAVQLLLKAAETNAAVLNDFLIARRIKVNQNQFDAMMDLTLNVGVQWLYYYNSDGTGCRLVELLKKGSDSWTKEKVEDAFSTWAMVDEDGDGKVDTQLPGLVQRRKDDAALFMTPEGETPSIYPTEGNNGDTTPTNPPEDTDDGDGGDDNTDDENSDGFTDVPQDAWYYTYVMKAKESGLMQGMGNGVFSPETEVTRAQMVQALANFAGADLSSYKSSSFTDVSTGDWYAPAVAWASEQGYVNGMGDGTFHPEDTIIREHLCNILARYLQSQGFVKTTTVDKFTDDALISDSGRDQVYFCVAMGIVNGMGDGTFSPNTGATRGQLAKLLVEMYDLEDAAG